MLYLFTGSPECYFLGKNEETKNPRDSNSRSPQSPLSLLQDGSAPQGGMQESSNPQKPSNPCTLPRALEPKELSLTSQTQFAQSTKDIQLCGRHQNLPLGKRPNVRAGGSPHSGSVASLNTNSHFWVDLELEATCRGHPARPRFAFLHLPPGTTVQCSSFLNAMPLLQALGITAMRERPRSGV